MTPNDRRLLSLLLLCLAVLDKYGDLSTAALVALLLSIAVAAHSFSAWGRERPTSRLTSAALLVALASTTLLYDNRLPGHVFVATGAGLVVAILVYTVARAAVARVVAVVCALGSLVAGIASNMTWGKAPIDVFDFQQAAAQALLHGQNPYSPLVASPEYLGTRIIAVHLHFPYGPILPVLEAPLRLLGDVRLLHVVAALLTAAMVILLGRRAGTLDRATPLAMAFPLTTGMIVFGWVDVITMAALATWLVTFRSHPRVATVALVVALGAKPTTIIALVPIAYWSVRARRQLVIATAATVAFVTPFALATGVGHFIHNVIGVQLEVPARLDALTLNAYLHSIGMGMLPVAVSGVVVAIAVFFVVRQRPSTYGELLTGTAILSMVSFLVAKWAFFNYYYIPAVLLLLAVAGDRLPLDDPAMLRPPSAVQWFLDAARRAVVRRRGAPAAPHVART